MSKRDAFDTFNYLKKTLNWSKKQKYFGYSKHDALSSPFLRFMSLGNRFLRLVYTQVVTRAPVNIRPLLGVPEAINPKGMGLFAHAYCDLKTFLAKYPHLDTSHMAEYCASESDGLLAWLDINCAPWTSPINRRTHDQLEGKGWGYQYPWQDVGFYQPAHFPNRVVTSWIGFAYIRAYEVLEDPKYLEKADEIGIFLLNNPNKIVDDEKHLCLSYVPLEEVTWAVMDVSALAAAMCMRLSHHMRETKPKKSELYRRGAERLMAFVVDKQTDYGGWFYTWPAKDSHIKHDNYHTGIILDCLADYMTYSGDFGYMDVYRKGLDYYRDELFLENGAPCWMNDKIFPHDIHGAAAGILAFSRAAALFGHEQPEADKELGQTYLHFSDLIKDWTLDHMYHADGFFYYQKLRMRTKKFCLMRWCNAWMCRALAQNICVAELLSDEKLEGVPVAKFSGN